MRKEQGNGVPLTNNAKLHKMTLSITAGCLSVNEIHRLRS